MSAAVGTFLLSGCFLPRRMSTLDGRWSWLLFDHKSVFGPSPSGFREF